MHASVASWFRHEVACRGLADKDALEVASYATDDAPVRNSFTGRYIGVDRRPGPNVDMVAEAANLPFPDCEFDVVACTEMLEHDDAPWLSLVEIRRVLKPNGVLLLTARGFDDRGCYPVHDHPVDYWRFHLSLVPVLLRNCGYHDIVVTVDPEAPGFFASALA